MLQRVIELVLMAIDRDRISPSLLAVTLRRQISAAYPSVAAVVVTAAPLPPQLRHARRPPRSS
jgi:hypothetical protein